MFLETTLSTGLGHAHCSVLNGLVDGGLELRADLLNLGRRHVVVVPLSELEHDGVPANHQSARDTVHKEEVQRCCCSYSWAERKSHSLLLRARYGRTLISATMFLAPLLRIGRLKACLKKMKGRMRDSLMRFEKWCTCEKVSVRESKNVCFNTEVEDEGDRS